MIFLSRWGAGSMFKWVIGAPIKRLRDGSYDHRGSSEPVSGCPCQACLCTIINFIAKSSDEIESIDESPHPH